MIIGIGHRQQVGKDHAARLISRTYDIAHVSFAKPLYDICERTYAAKGFKSKEFYDHYPFQKEVYLPDIGMTPRQILIEVGSNCFRKIYDKTWIDLALHRPCVVSDVRFLNEAEEIKKRGGVLIKVERDVFKSSDVADSNLEEYTGWDHIIKNDSDLTSFNEKVLKIAEKIFYNRG